MNEVNKTLYIPLYGKAMVSAKGMLLMDPMAETIWQQVQFPLKGKSRSKWLAYFMAMRARVFDEWVTHQMTPETVVLHIGCGLDSRVQRVNNPAQCWLDIDFPQVIQERKKHFQENERYRMLGADASSPEWVAALPEAKQVIVVLEGISMYLPLEKVQGLLSAIAGRYERVHVLMDVYTILGAKASRYKNPINDVGVTRVYGLDDPEAVIAHGCLRFVKEHDMAPKALVDELQGFERWFFSHMFAGKMAKRLYRLFEYET